MTTITTLGTVVLITAVGVLADAVHPAKTFSSLGFLLWPALPSRQVLPAHAGHRRGLRQLGPRREKVA